MSFLLYAIVIWAFFEMGCDQRFHAEENKWMIFIAYFVGLSIVVHLLILVNATAFALIYYFFKKIRKAELKGGSIRYVFWVE